MADAVLALRLAVGTTRHSDLAAYERAWTDLTGGHALAVASGRGALSIALRASGIGPDDEVIVTGYTCVAVPVAVRSVGALPRFADVDPYTGNMTPETAAVAVTRRTKAIVVQHFLGNPADVEGIRSVLPASMVVIEDAVHALGSKRHGRMVGQDGDWCVFGTEQSKPISTGQGGVLVANTAETADRLRLLPELPTWRAGRTRQWLLRVGLDRIVSGLRAGPGLLPSEVLHRALHRAGLARITSTDALEDVGAAPRWREARLPVELAAVGLRQVKRLGAVLEHRRRIAGVYDSLVPERGRMAVAAGAEPVWLRYPVRANDGERVYSKLRDLGFDPGGRWFGSPIYPQPFASLDYRLGSCPGAEQLAREIVNLPTHPLISPIEAERLADTVADVLDV